MLTASHALWATNTAGQTAAARLSMQTDGNLVLYDTSSDPLWASSQHGGALGSGAGLGIQDDGNLVIYGANNIVLWASNTTQQ